jgi:transposase InsO family protein
MRPDRDRALATRIHQLAQQHPSYGYRLITAMLNREGWVVNAKCVYRLWRQAGLSHRPKPRKRRRLGSSENSCVRMKPTYPNHVWSYDFLFDATEDGRRLKWMPVLDEYTRECLALEVERSITSSDVICVLDRLIAERGAPSFIRSDNGPEFIAEAVRTHLADLEVDTRFIAPGAPWENGYVESFNGTLRVDLLDREIFGHHPEAKVLGKQYRQEYNTERPHSALDYQTPAEFAASYVADSALTKAPT